MYKELHHKKAVILLFGVRQSRLGPIQCQAVLKRPEWRASALYCKIRSISCHDDQISFFNMSLCNFTMKNLCFMSTLLKEIKYFLNWLNIVGINHLVKQNIQSKYLFDNSFLIITEKSSLIFLQTYRAIFYTRLSCVKVNIDGSVCFFRNIFEYFSMIISNYYCLLWIYMLCNLDKWLICSYLVITLNV
jgi:hypothetical protein